MFKFSWWKTEDNREGAKAIVDILKIAVPAALIFFGAVYAWINGKENPKPDPAPVVIDSGGGAVQTGNGMQIVQRDNGTVIIGYSIEKHEAILTARMKELRADLERATTAEKTLISNELNAVATQLKDLEQSHAAAVEDLRLLRLRLKEFEGQVSDDELAKAQQALFEGDRKLADTLFSDMEAKLADQVKLAASAAFGRGEVAESEIRWHDAAKHYARAARLEPDFQALFKAREFAWRAGDYSAAFRHGEDLLSLARSGGDQEQLAAALNEHALTLDNQGQFSEAEALYREALAIDEETIGVEHPEYAIHLNNLAGVVVEQGRYEEAEALYREALAIAEATIGKAHPKYAIRLNNLALVVKALGRYEEAEALYREALEIGEKTIGTEHPNHATRLNNLALVLKAQGRYEEAEGLYREALAIDEKTIGTEHPEYAKHLNNLAAVVEAQGGVGEAEPLYREAVEIALDRLGPDHPSTKTLQANLDRLLARKP